MTEVLMFLRSLGDSGGFSPHAFCLAYDTFALYASRLGHRLVFISYLAISLQLMIGGVTHWRASHYHRGFRIVPTRGTWAAVLLFAVFILSCGIGHMIMDMNFELSLYRLEAAWHVWTGAISLVTALVLPIVVRLESVDSTVDT